MQPYDTSFLVTEADTIGLEIGSEWNLGAADPAEIAAFLTAMGLPVTDTTSTFWGGHWHLVITIDADDADATYGRDALTTALVANAGLWTTEGYDADAGPFWSPGSSDEATIAAFLAITSGTATDTQRDDAIKAVIRLRTSPSA